MAALIVAHVPSMEQWVFGAGYDAPDYDTCMQRANLFDIGKENSVQIAEQLTFWDAVRSLLRTEYQKREIKF